MSLNYTNQYIQSILSFLDYVTFNGKNELNVDLRGLDLTEPNNKILFNDAIMNYMKNEKEYNNMKASLDFFTDHFLIVNQNTAANYNGFSGTTYQLVNPIEDSKYEVGEFFVSYRGTEDSYGDYLTDLKLTFFDTFTNPITSQEPVALDYLKNVLSISGNNKVNISGHSLGGYLAARSYYHLSLIELEKIGEVSTFNGAGFSVFDGPFIGSLPFINFTNIDKYREKINNIFSFRGLNVTTSNIGEMFNIANILKGQGTIISTFQHLGPRIGKFTENPGGFTGNHSVAMLAKSMGFFAILSKLIQDVYIVKDGDNQYVGEDAVVYLIDKMLMGSVPETNDFGLAYDTLSKKIIEMFEIPKELISEYSSPTSQFLSLANYFKENSNLKIKMFDSLYATPPSLTNIDSNSNRAYMYALLNDLSFTVIVPDSYNTGIYQKVNNYGLEDLNNIKYNVEYYTADYIKLRTTYNKAYTAVLSDKILNDLPRTFTNATLNVDGFSKFAFIDESNINKNTSEINDYRVIFINTNKSEYLNDLVPLIYFKADNKKMLDVRLGNSIVYDTPNSDSIRVYSNNNVINSTYGTDIIEIVSGTIGNVIMLKDLTGTDKEQSLILRNNSDREHSLTIKSDNINFGELIGKLGDNKDFTLDFGNKVVILSGQTDLNIKGAQYNAATMNALVTNFPELFTSANGHNLVFDENFIDDYIKITSKNFEGQLGYESTQTISAEHADYVIGKITGYTNELKDTASSFIDEMKAHINSRITSISTDLDNDGLQDDILNQVIPLIKDKVKSKSVAFIIQNKLNDFKYLDLGHQVNMATEDGMANNRADNIYGKKETKNYIAHYDSKGDVYWVWDGNYYYNRAIDSVQVEAFYNGSEIGQVMNYYVENIVLKSSSTFSSNVLYGSNGSDLLIGEHVYGQTNDFGVAGSKTVTEAKTIQNGNDILIGKVSSAYSGNNFIYGSEAAYGGSGNDLIIGGGTIMANQDFTNDAESSNNENEIIILSSADVYSSNGRNNIIDLGTEGSNIFGTRNDTFIGGSGHSIFIGGYNAYSALRYDKISFSIDGGNFLGQFRMKFNIIDDFYNLHKFNQSIAKNVILAGTGGVSASLGYGDYIENLKGGGQIIGLGGNDIFIKDKTDIISGGSSNINIKGSNNLVYFGVKDRYSLSNANENTLYSRGYRDNVNIGNDDYQITGIHNTLILGNSSYNIKLDGERSQVTFKENNNNNNIVINESGTTYIDVGFQNILTIESQNEISLRNGELVELLINTSSPLSLSSIIAERIVSKNYNGMNNSDLVTFYGVTVDNLTVSSGIITGSVMNTLFAYFEGILSGFSLEGNSLGADIKLKGFIDGVNTSFEAVKSFDFTQNLRMSEQPRININNSNISTYTTSGNSILAGVNNNISILHVTGNTNTVGVDGNVGIANISSSNELSFNAKSVQSLNANYNNTILIKGTRIGGEISLGMSETGSSLRVDNANFIEVSNTGFISMILLASNSDIINIMSGYYNGAVFTNVKTVNIDLDTVSPMSSFNGDNIHLTSTKPLSARYSNNKYYLNNVEFTLLPDTITVSGRQYTSEQLAILFEVLKKSNLMQATAIVDVTGVGYDSIGDANNEGIHVDSGIYIGTDSNDVVYATDNKAYRIKGNKGNDFIDFGTKPRNTYTHIIEYNRGDGLDTITSNAENIEIRLGTIRSNELSFKNVEDSVTNNKTLQVFLGNEQIFSIIGFDISNIQFKAYDKILTKSDVISLIGVINGTDNGETIQGLLSDTYIVAGKGNDTVNFIGNNKNVLYYNKGDGVDTINSNYNFEIIFSSGIDMHKIGQCKLSDNIFELYLDGVKILILNNADKSKFIFSDGQIVDGYYINSSFFEQLGGTPFYENGVYTGTDLADYFNLEQGYYYLKGNKGNDTFDFKNNSQNSIIEYNEGDGFDKIQGVNKKIDIDMINLSSEFFTTSSNGDDLDLYYKGIKIMNIDNIKTSRITINLSDTTFVQSDILLFTYGRYGTTGDEIITNNPRTDNFIYAGKGNDIINLIGNQYSPELINNIYYFKGDGHKTINNDEYSSYKIIFDYEMSESDLSYQSGFVNGSVMLYISYKNDVIFTIPSFNANDFTIDYLSTGNSVNMDSLAEQVMIVNGTNGDDILTSEQGVAIIDAGDGDDIINVSSHMIATDISSGLGNDIININNNGFNHINYDDGDGYDTIVLDNHDTSINLNLYDYDEVNIRFEYDLSNSNNLNIYNNDTKIITIENYVIDDVPFESIVIELNDSTLESYDINTKASEGSQAARMLVDSNINGLISIMAIDNNDVDSLGEGQSASTFIKKNE